MRITVIIPTYNESENLPGLVSGLFLLPLDLSLLIVDDNSPDGTGRLADELGAQHPGRMRVLHRSEKLGLRSAYLEGFAIALADGAQAVVQMDADGSHAPASLPGMVKALEEFDLVLGSRYVPGGSLDERWSASRKHLSAFGNAYARTILLLPLRDVTTGYRAWKASALAKIPLERIRSNGYVFLVEMAYLAHRLGLRIREMPIHFAERTRGESKMSLLIQAEAAIRVWQVRFAHRSLETTHDGESAPHTYRSNTL